MAPNFISVKNMKLKISVIVCTHNPREDYFSRVLDALRRQSLGRQGWELLVVDNSSEQPLSGRISLEWHGMARIISESELGLTNARLRGISESQGELLVFVDDDNVLHEDYLEAAIRIAEKWPCLGAWSGRVVPEYEAQPDSEMEPYLWLLCIRDVQSPKWGNTGSMDVSPWGAGMCVRREVASRYAEDCAKDSRKSLLDRKGQSLGSSGDIDLALASLSLGLGTGVFPELEVLHFIAARRLSRDYLVKLIEDSTTGGVLFETLLGKQAQAQKSGIDQLVSKYKYFRANSTQKAVAKAIERGLARGKEMIDSLTNISQLEK